MVGATGADVAGALSSGEAGAVVCCAGEDGADRLGLAEGLADGADVVAVGTLLVVVLDVDVSGSDVTEDVPVEEDGVGVLGLG